MEHYAAALLDTGWDADVLERRIKVFEMRVAGVPMKQISEQLEVSERQCYYDWAAVRDVCAAVGSPILDEIRAKADARFERLYTDLAKAALGAVTTRDKVRCIREARNLIVDQLRLHGVIQNGTNVTVQTGPDDRRDLATQTDDELRATARTEANATLQLLEEMAGVRGNGKAAAE